MKRNALELQLAYLNGYNQCLRLVGESIRGAENGAFNREVGKKGLVKELSYNFKLIDGYFNQMKMLIEAEYELFFNKETSMYEIRDDKG